MGWQQTAGFFRQLAVLTRTGMPLGTSLRLAGETAGGGYRAHGLQWSVGCTSGLDLASQLTAAGESQLVCALVRAGEATGKLPELCARIADHYDQLQALRSLAVGRLIYPVVLLHVALVVPLIPRLFTTEMSAWWLLAGPLTLWAFVIGVVLVARLWHASGLLARLVLLPGPGFVVQPFLTCNLCLVLSAAMAAGLKVRDALELAAEAVGNRVLAARLRDAARQVDNGTVANLTQALATVHLPASLLMLISAGEQSGTLDRSLDQAAVAARESFQVRALWTTKAFTSAIYSMVVLFVAWQIISLYSGVMQQAGGDPYPPD
jgi:type II secretory pathway component PulF